jgi:hypothetical protein
VRDVGIDGRALGLGVAPQVEGMPKELLRRAIEPRLQELISYGDVG